MGSLKLEFWFFCQEKKIVKLSGDLHYLAQNENKLSRNISPFVTFWRFFPLNLDAPLFVAFWLTSVDISPRSSRSIIISCVFAKGSLSAFLVEMRETKRKLLFWGRRNDAFILEMKWRGKQHLPRNSICNKTCLREERRTTSAQQ